MKTIKQRWLKTVTILSLILGVFFAVSAVENNKTQKVNNDFEHWDHVGNNPQNASEYQKADPGTSCPGSELVCQIYAPADMVTDPTGNTPDLSAYIDDTETETVSDRIQDAIDNGPNETVSMKDNE